MDLGFRIYGVWVWGLEFRVKGSGFRVYVKTLEVYGIKGLRV